MSTTKELPETYTGPGLVDIQVNGYGNFDFNSVPDAAWTAEEFHRIRGMMARRGVLACFPTFITDDTEAMLARARRYRELVEADAELAQAYPRLHIEGPFISPEDGPRGAHPKEHCRTPEQLPDLMDRLQEASGGRMAIVTLAPELPGARGLIRRLVDQGLRVAIAHTNTSKEDLDAAVDAGVTMSTHLGNGSHQMLPRLANYIQAQLAEDRMMASFIADGHHVPFYTLKNFVRAKTPERAVLTTDAMSAADNGPGEYMLGGGPVIVTEDLRAARPGEPGLAGSALTLDLSILNAVQHTDVTFEEAWTMASTRPAAIAGLEPYPDVTVSIGAMGFCNTQAK